MPDIITCPFCQRKLRCADVPLGQQVRCSACRGTFVPSRDEAPSAPPPAPPPVAVKEAKAPVTRPRRRLAVVAAALGGALLLVLVACGIAGFIEQAVRNLPGGTARLAFVEDEGPRRREVREAFAGPGLADAGELPEQLKPLFDDLAEAYRARDGGRLLALYDAARMLDEVAAQSGVSARKLGGARSLEVGLKQALPTQAEFIQWTTCEIRHVKRLGPDDVVIIARHRHPDGFHLKLRWWAVRRLATWKVYDMEDLDVGIRLSTTMASIAHLAPGQIEELNRGMSHLRAALLALGAAKPDDAERSLQQIAGLRLPAKLEAVRLLARGMLQLHRTQWQDALDSLEQAHRQHPDMPILDLLRGTAFNGLGKWEQAHKHLVAYRDLLGEDAVICNQLGLALRGLERFPQAAAAYRKALDDDPKDADAFQGLLNSLGPDDKRDDVPARFARLDKPHDAFTACALECLDGPDKAGLEQLVAAMRKADARFAPVDHYDALLKAWAGQAEQAVALFKSAQGKEKDAEKRQEYARAFQQAMAAAGKAVAAYAAAPEPGEAFRLLAGELKRLSRFADLKALLAEHAKKHAGDALLPFYRGEVYVSEENYPLAEEAFAAGLRKPPDRQAVEEFRAARVQARYYTGRAMSAYKEIGPREETFTQLAALLYNDGDDAQLQALIEAHAQTYPTSFELLQYRCRLKVRQGATAEAVGLFKTLLERQKQPEKQAGLTSTFFRDMIEAGKAVEAYRAAPAADAREAFEELASELSDEDRYDELKRLMEAHRAGHADDPALLFYAGEIHAGEGAWDRAADAFGKAWKAAPEDRAQQIRSHYLRALYQVGRWRWAYDEVGPREATFTSLVGLLLADKKGPEVTRLIDSERRRAGDGPDLLLHEARARLLMNEPAAALSSFRAACAKQATPQLASGYVRQFVGELADSGRGLEGYRAAPDRPAAFEVLARRLLDAKKTTELAALLDEHAKKHAGDPSLLAYQGELLLLGGDNAGAERHFAAALAKTPLDWRLSHSLSRAQVRAGTVVRAYQGSGREGFERLAPVCVEEGHVGQLEALLAAHRRAAPEDARLPLWDLEVKWLKKDYEGALRLLGEHRTGLFAVPRYRGKADDYQVRCLVRLKKAREAVEAAEASRRGRRIDPLLLVLAYAADGQAEQAIAAFARQHLSPSGRRRFYQDEDLGPLLRGEAMRDFRARFPAEAGDEGGQY